MDGNSIMFKMLEAILAERDLFLPNRYCCLVSTFAEDRASKHLEASCKLGVTVPR